MTDLTNPIFNDADAAREHLEATRWPNGPVCPHCQAKTSRVHKVEGTKKAHRKGLYHCNDCEGQFTVTVGTVLEQSHVPLNKWLLAFYLMCGSKKGISAHQLHRSIKVSYKTAWFMGHRIREAMRAGGSTRSGSKKGGRLQRPPFTVSAILRRARKPKCTGMSPDLGLRVKRPAPVIPDGVATHEDHEDTGRNCRRASHRDGRYGRTRWETMDHPSLVWLARSSI